jgi:hypothetical protein
MYPRRSSFRISVFLGMLLLGLVFPGLARSVDPDLCIGGDTYGAWDLPSEPGEPGQASGVLVVDQSGKPLFSLDAELTEKAHPMEFRLGDMDGILADSSGTPLYGIAGTWRTFPRDDANGRWQATIYRLDTAEPVGMITAEFASEPGQEGMYAGQWVICELP